MEDSPIVLSLEQLFKECETRTCGNTVNYRFFFNMRIECRSEGHVSKVAPGVLHLQGAQTERRDPPEWLQPSTEGPTKGAPSSMEDAPRAVVVTIPPPAVPPPEHKSAIPS